MQDPSKIQARSTLVAWSYSSNSDAEAPISSYRLQYQNSSFTDILLLSASTKKELIHLKPYTDYSVRIMAESILGKGSWSDRKNFTTKTTGN